jgi:WD40 repeat protein
MAPIRAALTPSQIATCGDRLLGNGCWPGVPCRWQQLWAIRKLREDSSPAAARSLALAATWRPPKDGAIRERLLGALAELLEPAQLQVMAEVATADGPHSGSAPVLALLRTKDRFALLTPSQRVAVAVACGHPALLAEEGSEVVPLLLQAWSQRATKEAAGMALRALRSPTAIDALCRQLIAMGAAADPLRQELLLAQPHSATSPSLRQRLLADVIEQGRSECIHADDWADVVQLLSRTDDGEVLWRWALKAPPEYSRPLLQAIPMGATLPPAPWVFFHPHLQQVVAEVATAGWPERVSPPLIGILRSARFLPCAPPKLRVAVALACGWSAGLAEDGPTILPPLLEAWSLEATQAPARTALLALRTPATIDALCRRWITEGEAGDSLAALLLEAGHAPSDPAERALFWMLSGQLEAYDQLDGDGALLAKAQAAAPAPVRQRLAAASVAAGRTEWLQVVQQSQPLEAFSADDWTAAVQVVARTGDAETLWRWALQSPPLHTRTLLRAIPAGTDPPPHLGEGARALLAMAQDLPAAPDLARFLPNQCSHTLHSHGFSEKMWMAWAADGRCLATSRGDHAIRIWDPVDGVCSHTLSGHNGSVHAIAWAPKCVVLAHVNTDMSIRLWDPTSGATPLSALHRAFSRSPIRFLSWSPDGRWLASGGTHDTIRLWDAGSGACTHHLPDHTGEERSMAWSPDGRYLAYGSARHTIRLWEAARGQCTQILQAPTSDGRSIAWAPDGRCLASGSSDGTIGLWDPASGARTHTLPSLGGGVASIAWSPDGRWLASTSQGTIQLWDPRSGTCSQTLESPGRRIPAMAWSPDGRCLATTSGDREIGIWDPASGARLHTLNGHNGAVHGLAWSPDGRQLASAGADETIRLWTHHHPILVDVGEVLTTPFLHFQQRHWSKLATVHGHTLPTAEWRWIRPWLAFIHTLGQMMRRFDVDVEKTTPQQQESPFAVFLDG